MFYSTEKTEKAEKRLNNNKTPSPAISDGEAINVYHAFVNHLYGTSKPRMAPRTMATSSVVHRQPSSDPVTANHPSLPDTAHDIRDPQLRAIVNNTTTVTFMQPTSPKSSLRATR
ncbi:unnamed protein product [Vicia faba]|uniref:Uncharacterized protein n=1 Tax=Vicia faba TaxID=3906 RepID=A0AAV1A2F1_VICFA|nr:unnamed protein product [Vicia faba]